MSLSLEEKVGQILMFGMHGTSVTDRVRRLAAERHVGGWILFLRNIESVGQLQDLTGELQELSDRTIFIAADQEGGAVLRLREGATLLPSAMGLGTLEPDRSRRMGEICGREMRAMGLNVNLAPVLDINHPGNPGLGIRSFGEDPDRVTRHGLAYLEGLRSTGTLATIKHYPGKGRAQLDSHLDLPRLDLDRGDVDGWELAPFRAAIEAGTDMVMTSHCVYSKIDDVPATLSRTILTDLLRTELGFDGVLITDDMEMGAISRYYPGPAASLKSFEAGADQLLICADEALQDQVIDELIEGFESGRLSRERLDESVARVARVRDRIAPREGDIRQLESEHAPEVDAVLREMIVITRDPDGVLPLVKGSALRVFWPTLGSLTKVEEGQAGPEFLKDRLEELYGSIEWIEFDPRSGPGSVDASTTPTLFFTANAHLFEGQANALEAASRTDALFVHVVLRNPYDADLTDRGACVRTYGFLENSIRAMTETLCGPRSS